MKSVKIEIFPDGFSDGTCNAIGPCALVLHIHKPNVKRFNTLTNIQRDECLEHIERFERQLQYLKDEVRAGYKGNGSSTSLAPITAPHHTRSTNSPAKAITMSTETTTVQP